MSSVKVLLVAALMLTALVGLTALSVTNQQAAMNPGTGTLQVTPSSTGTSTISINKTSVDIASGGSSQVSYTVKLASGTTWGTTISANGPTGITTAFSTSQGDPTYTGTATISVASSVKNGTYTVSFSASGDDPTSSPTVLNVTVTGYSSYSPPPKSTYASNIGTNGEYAGIGVFAVFLILAFVPLAAKRLRSNSVGFGSFVVSMASAIYLAAFDNVLYHSAFYHWIILVLFIILGLATMIGHILAKGRNRRLIGLSLGIGSFIMSIGMLLDAALGLPLSSVQNIGSLAGFSYLFGFGFISGSSFETSIAFSLMLIFNGLVFSSFARKGE